MRIPTDVRGRAHPRRMLCAPLLWICAGLVPGVAWSESALNLRAKVGLGGDYRQGGVCRVGMWTPACVEIANAGTSFRGRVEVFAEGPDGSPIVSSAALTVAKGTMKRIVLPVRVHTYQRHFRVRLVDGRGREAKGAKAPARVVDPARLIGVVTSLGRPGLPVSAPDARRIRVAYLDPADLAADARVYDALDALVVLDPRADCVDPVSASRAMRAWVASGRRAVVTVGAAGPEMAGGPAAWAAGPPIARSAGVEAFDALRRTFAPGANEIPPRRAVVADLRGQPGRVLAADPAGLPLAIERAVGLGRLRLVAPDLQAAPFLGWDGTQRLWDRLLDLPTRKQAQEEAEHAFTGRDPLQAAFESLRFLAPVSIGFVILFLIAYILVVGPGDWWILRSLGRRYAWTWLTVPLWSLLFCGILYAVTAYKRGGDLTVRAASVIDVVPGEEDVGGVSYVAIYSPGSRRYDVRIDAPAGWIGPRGVGEGHGGISFGGRGGAYAEGTVPGFHGFPIASNVMRTLESAWRIPRGSYGTEVTGVGTDEAFTLANRGTRALEDVFVVWPDRTVAKAGAIAAGASVDVPAGRVPLEDFLESEEADPQEIVKRFPRRWGRSHDATTAKQDEIFLAHAWDILLWMSLRTLAYREAVNETVQASGVFGGPDRLIPDRRARRLDAAPALPHFRYLVIGRDASSPAPVRIDKKRPKVTETVMVRIWVP